MAEVSRGVGRLPRNLRCGGDVSREDGLNELCYLQFTECRTLDLTQCRIGSASYVLRVAPDSEAGLHAQ